MQFRFQPLRFSRPKIESIKQPVKPDYVREVIMKIGQANVDAILPQLLSDSDVHSEVLFRFQAEVFSENLVLAAWRTEPSTDTGMHNGICFVEFIAACKAIGPNAAKLIEVLETSPSDEDQIFHGRQRCL